MKMMQLYEWSDDDEIIESQYGTITCREWIEHEFNRIVSDTNRVAEVREKGHKVTLFVNQVAP